MKRILYTLISLVCFMAASSGLFAQGGSSLVLDEASFSPVNTDAMTGLNIDPIAKDRSNRECARVKIHVTRMTAEDIAGISVRTVGGNILVMRQIVAAGGNGIIVEMTARPGTRFYLHHDIFGESNVVTVDLEGSKEYNMEAWCNLFQTITVACDRVGAGVFLDGRYKGVIGDQGVLVIPDVTTGQHQINVADTSDEATMMIDVSRSNVYFSIALQDSSALQQFVLFKVDPADATVEFDGAVLPVSDGTASKMMRFGTYAYKVYAPGYHPAEGSVTVNSVERRSEVNVKLKPAVGILEIKDNPSLNGADVYVDDRYIGRAPLTTARIASGQHKLRLVKPMYEPYEQDITIYDGKTLRISQQLVPAFVSVTLRAVPGGEIWVNNEYKGIAEWAGNLSKGACRFEVRKEGYRTAYLSKDLNSTEPVTINLPAPEPIYGKLIINSTPAVATVEISGMAPQETPVIISKILVGSHEVRIRKSGYQDYVTTVAVSEERTSEINAVLKKGSNETSPSDGDTSVATYIDKANKGEAWAQNNLGDCYYLGDGVEQDYTKAVALYLMAAAQGYAEAMCNLGYCYFNGEGVKQDYAMALQWWHKAAEQRFAEAQYNLGECYYSGEGVKQDYPLAVSWYRLAAEQGFDEAQNMLGLCYDNGTGVDKDHVTAAQWYRKAAEQGYAPAQNNIGVCYEIGEGVTKNTAEAAIWYRKAAEQDHEHAQYNLGMCYEFGDGVIKDISEAKKWYRKAADNGHEKARERLLNL